MRIKHYYAGLPPPLHGSRGASDSVSTSHVHRPLPLHLNQCTRSYEAHALYPCHASGKEAFPALTSCRLRGRPRTPLTRKLNHLPEEGGGGPAVEEATPFIQEEGLQSRGEEAPPCMQGEDLQPRGEEAPPSIRPPHLSPVP